MTMIAREIGTLGAFPPAAYGEEADRLQVGQPLVSAILNRMGEAIAMLTKPRIEFGVGTSNKKTYAHFMIPDDTDEPIVALLGDGRRQTMKQWDYQVIRRFDSVQAHTRAGVIIRSTEEIDRVCTAILHGPKPMALRDALQIMMHDPSLAHALELTEQYGATINRCLLVHGLLDLDGYRGKIGRMTRKAVKPSTWRPDEIEHQTIRWKSFAGPAASILALKDRSRKIFALSETLGMKLNFWFETKRASSEDIDIRCIHAFPDGGLNPLSLGLTNASPMLKRGLFDMIFREMWPGFGWKASGRRLHDDTIYIYLTDQEHALYQNSNQVGEADPIMVRFAKLPLTWMFDPAKPAYSAERVSANGSLEAVTLHEYAANVKDLYLISCMAPDHAIGSLLAFAIDGLAVAQERISTIAKPDSEKIWVNPPIRSERSNRQLGPRGHLPRGSDADLARHAQR